jgi:DNA invertase Pin-like site-specific DNA recombinase
MVADMKNGPPAKRALRALIKPAGEAEPNRRISAKVRTGIDAMVSGQCKTIKEAAEKAGLSREHFTRELSKPHIAEHLRQKVSRHLAIMATAPDS